MAEAPQVKAVIGFGTKSAMAGETPKAIKYVYRTLMFLGGLWALLEPYFQNVPPTTAHAIDKWVLVGNVLIYYICQQFGWVVPADASKQTTQV